MPVPLPVPDNDYDNDTDTDTDNDYDNEQSTSWLAMMSSTASLRTRSMVGAWVFTTSPSVAGVVQEIVCPRPSISTVQMRQTPNG